MEIKIIKGKGVEDLNLEEQDVFDRLVGEYSKKVERMSSEISSLEIYIKDYKKDGKSNRTRKYAVHLRVISPHPVIKTDADDFIFATALHKSFDKLLNELEHKFRKSDQHSNTREPQRVRTRRT
jgi:hypothetical protein